MMRSSTSTISLGVVALLALTSTGPSADAATDQPAATAGFRACVVEPAPAGVTVPEPVAPRCFDSFAAAISDATDGTVRLPRGATEVSQAQLDAGRAADRLASTVIGIEYDGSGYTGNQWIISQVNGCNDGGAEVWLRADLTGTAMNDVISSAKAYGGCRSRHFEHANFAGSSSLCGCSLMGTMSDRTTSIRWSATGF